MGLIKQLKQFITGTQIFPVTKTKAIYDDKFGRLDVFMQSLLAEADVLETGVGDTPRDADTLGGHLPTYFAKPSDIDTAINKYHEIRNLPCSNDSTTAITLSLDTHYLVMAKNSYNYGGLYLIECGVHVSLCNITVLKESPYITLTPTGKNTFTVTTKDAGYYINAHALALPI